MEHQPALALDVIEKTPTTDHRMVLCAPEDMLNTIVASVITRRFKCADVSHFRRYSGGTALTQIRGWVQVAVPYDLDQRNDLDALVEDIMRQSRVLGKPILEVWIGGCWYRYTIKR